MKIERRNAKDTNLHRKQTEPNESPDAPLNWLHTLIRESMGAPTDDLGEIETIMRDDIFHSTLDWQSREQLTDAAREAYEQLKDCREVYDLGPRLPHTKHK